MTPRLRRRLPAVIALALLAGCTSAPAGPYGSISEPDSALFAIKTYYERRGREQNGTCSQMILEDVLGAQPVDAEGEDLILRVRYAYSARSGNSNRQFGCNGFATRDFTVVETDSRWQVLAMSDPLT